MDEQAIFTLAIEEKDPAEREAFLENACAGSEQLRRSVDLLLKAYEKAGAFLEYSPSVIATAVKQSIAAESPGTQIGPYQLLQRLGRGAMGVVYEAEEIALGRRVALKILPFAALLNQNQLERFNTEATAAARLHHPGIVTVYSVGCEGGIHYYSMQLIEGPSLAQVIAELRSVG